MGASLLLPVLITVVTYIPINFGEPPTRLAVAVQVVSTLALFGRRRWPRAVCAIEIIALFWIQPWMQIPIAIYTVAAAPVRRRSLIALWVGAAVMFGWSTYRRLLFGEVQLTYAGEVFMPLVTLASMVGVPTVLGFMVRSRREQAVLAARQVVLTVELLQSRAQAEELAAASARAEERAALARDMHDVVAHTVSLISIHAGALSVGPYGSEVQARAETIRKLSKASLEELREMLDSLRGAEPGGNLTETISAIPHLVYDSELTVELTIDPAVAEQRIDYVIQHAIHRVIREALTNIRKHAPTAPVQITLDVDAGTLRLMVRNEICPAESHPEYPPSGYGLIGLRERIEALGGTFESGPQPDGGFVVRAHVPVTTPPDSSALAVLTEGGNTPDGVM